ncbi:MAG TPA: hypothetical protein VMX79_08785 [bacterium]|nr:hypothetical protein [bacterium]
MKTALFVTAALLVAIAVQAYAFGSLVSSFHAPGDFPNGVGYRAANLYIGTNTPDMCWRTTTTGSIVRSHTSPTTDTMGVAAGVIGSTGFYWVASHDPRMIYQVGFNSGSIYHSFSVPSTYPYGVAFRSASYIYHTDSGTAPRLYLMHPTNGSVYASYTLSFDPNDVAYDATGYLWIVDSARIVRKCTLTGSTVDSFSVSSYGYPSGCAFDGTYVWVGFNAPLHSILQFTTTGSGVTPTSLGKVKALFR